MADVTGGLGDTAYDVVSTRFVLTHLRDLEAAVRHLYDAQRPGGRVIVEDVDFRGSFCEPTIEEFERYEEIYNETARCNGGDPDIGLHVPAMLVAAGFAHVRSHVVQPAGLEGEVKLLPALTLESIRAVAVRHRVSTDDEVDRLVARLYDVARDPRTFVGSPRIVHVWGDRT